MKKIIFIVLIGFSFFLFSGCRQIESRINNLPTDENIKDKKINIVKRDEMIKEDGTEEVAQKLVKDFDLEKITLVLTTDTIIVGVKTKNEKKINNILEIKEKIKTSIKKDIGNGKEVVVITSNNLLARIDKLALDIKEKKPIGGFLEEIRGLLKDVVPVI